MRYRFATVLLLLFAVGCLSSMKQKSSTYDEWGFISSGIQLLRPSLRVAEWDRFRLINPPLGRVPNALPLTFVDLRPSKKKIAHDEAASSREARRLTSTRNSFPFNWECDPRQLLFLARVPTVIEAMVLGLLVAWWASRIGGTGTWIGALLVFCLSPNMLAHSRLGTVDIAAALSFMGVLALAGRAIVKGGPVLLLAAGAVFGVALQAKLSAHLLIPILFIGSILAWRWDDVDLWSALGRAALIVVMGLLLNIALYGICLAPVARGTSYGADWDGGLAGSPQMAIRAYTESLKLVKTSQMKGFLVGKHYWNRYWSYYPIVVAAKTPLGLLLLGSLAAGLFLRLGRKRQFWHWWTVIPPLIFLLAAAVRGLNVGLRHILPAYAFALAGAGATLAWLWRRGGWTRISSIVVVLACAVPSLAVHPHYLAFFNTAVGGPTQGYRLLVDSNLDWGQDLPALAAYQKKHGIPMVTLSYFGTDNPDVYGVDYRLPSNEDPYRPRPGWYAVSATNLQGLYSYPDLRRWAWLRDHVSVSVPGHTIFLFYISQQDVEKSRKK